jgi:hypothetical protein
MARKMGSQPILARHYLNLHRRTYSVYWEWSDRVEATAMMHGGLVAAFGWRVRADPNNLKPNAKSFRNFPIQAAGGEMLRIACILASEAGIQICAIVHDAILIEASIEQIEVDVQRTQNAMQRASKIVLGGFCLRTDVKIVRYPDRYSDPRGESFWNITQDFLKSLPQTKKVTETHGVESVHTLP